MPSDMDADLEILGRLLDYNDLGREEWMFSRILRDRSRPWPAIAQDDSRVWSSLRRKYLCLVDLFELLSDAREEDGADLLRIERVIRRSSRERKACMARLKAVMAGAPTVSPSHSEETALLGASNDADLADGAGWAAIVAATEALIDIYPAAATEAKV